MKYKIQACQSAAKSYGERPPPYERFIDYPAREYPIKLLERGSALTQEWVNDIVSACGESHRVVWTNYPETCRALARLGEQNHGTSPMEI